MAGQFEAAGKTVDAMRSGGLLEDADDAIVAAVLGLAAAVDDEPGKASLWQQYLDALGELRSLGDDGGDDFDELKRWLSSPVRDSTI